MDINLYADIFSRTYPLVSMLRSDVSAQAY
jgi:hypothetical protein